MVDDLGAAIAGITERGVEPARREEYANGVRKTTYVDPDGNEMAVSRDQRNTFQGEQAFRGCVDEELGVVGCRAGRGVEATAKGRVVGLDFARAGPPAAVGPVVHRRDRRRSKAASADLAVRVRRC
jgi:hypothetical protein